MVEQFINSHPPARRAAAAAASAKVRSAKGKKEK
jgi:hypothetical protein